ncbi:hypothetical protein EUX98_g756 [Antrodiella citrinella]|uniref:DUF1751-domain-containing protein n=1 Tax=Antrodiella citrinella TaxID=2447956 RepID=A0A4S4N386_9APHY|nr:hypothetical protein EUX98_g756 [Antrodiella citrinella]
MAVLSTAPLQFVASIPPVTRAFTAATILSSLLYYVLWWRGGEEFSAPYLVLVPVFELALSLLVIPASLRYLERLYGAVETVKFIVVSVGVSNIIAFGLNWLEFLVLRNPMFLYGMQYHGQMALQIAVLVAFTQLIPEHQVQLFGFIKARVKTLPMSYVTVSTVLCILGFQSPWIVIQFGWLVSYLWLRFYKKNNDNVVGGVAYGDRSETFAFVGWFPPFIHTPITLLANTAYTIASRFHLIPLGSSSDVEAGYTQVPGGARAEAERRRAMALKALDQRVAVGSSSPSPRPGSASGNGPARPSNGEVSQPKLTAPTSEVDIAGGKEGPESR